MSEILGFFIVVMILTLRIETQHQKIQLPNAFIHYRALVLSSLAMCSERLSYRLRSLASATNPEGASEE